METLTLNGGIVTVRKQKPTMVKPESETPDGFYYLSSLDQAIPIFVDTIYCFEKFDETTIDVMKKSLAKILVLFYPLAGKLAVNANGRFEVDCNKQGVPFVEAVANIDIEDLGDMRAPDQDVSKKLIYKDPSPKNLLEFPLLTIQVTKFKCGGFTLGTTISHCIVDGVSAMRFYQGWAEVTRGLSPTIIPFHDRTLLKARDTPQPRYPFADYVPICDTSNMAGLYDREPMVSRTITFDSTKIAALKNMVLADGKVKRCSSFAAVTALLWRARNEALNMKANQLTKLLIMIDVRSRLDKPLCTEYFGNTVTTTGCLSIAGELAKRPLSYAVGMINNAVVVVNDDFIQSRLDYIEKYRPQLSHIGTLVVSAWTGLDYSGTDFGWGEPTQFGCAALAKELCVLLPHGEDKRGIAASLALPVSVMNTLEKLIQEV